MKRTIIYMMAVAGLLSAASLNGFCKDYYFKHYDRSNGLSHQTVYCSLQDSRGFMWFGTKSGLSRFDGHNFKNYTFGGSRKDAFASNVVNCIAETPDGTIWVGTLDGLIAYDPVKDIFSAFEYEGAPLDVCIDNMAVDKQGNLWATTGYGLFVIDPETDAAIHHKTNRIFTPLGITVTQAGRVWVAGSDGCVHQFDSNKGLVHTCHVLTPEEIRHNIVMYRITDYTNGELLITTNSAGARSLSPNTGKVEVLFTEDAEGSPIYIHTVLRISPEEYWFGSESGIHVYKIGSGFVERMYKSYDREYSLSDNAVHSLSMDREGGIWAGTFFGGVSYLSGDNSLFRKYLPEDRHGHVCANVIREIEPVDNGDLWIGTEDNGLCHFDASNRKISIRDDIKWHGASLPKNIQCLMLSDENEIWLGTFDSGIFILDSNTERVTRHYGSEGRDCGLSTSMIVSMIQTSSGDIVIGTNGSLYLYDKKSDKFIRFRNISGFIHSLTEDSHGNLWVGTMGSGLYRTDTRSLSKDADFIRHNKEITHITTVYEDNIGGIWVGTEGYGLYRYTSEESMMEEILSANDYPGMIIYQIVDDAMGNAWISTSFGLIQHNSHGVVNMFSKSNGLPIDQFNYNSSYQDREGTIYFGSLKGLVAFSPKDMDYKSQSLKVFFTGLWLYDKEIEAHQKDSPLRNSLLYTDEITLNHDQSVFSIQFSAPFFSISNNIWYRYKLEGVDSDWIISYGQKKLSYTKLPPGKYILNIQASDHYDSWPQETSRLAITIKPPKWASATAKFIYVTVFLMIAVLALWLFQRRMRMQAEANIERINNEKQKELLQAKISFFTNIAHEIRTPLTLIMGSLSRVKKKDAEAFDSDGNMKIMSKNTQRLYELINQLLDFRKIESSYFHMQFKRICIEDVVSETFNRFKPAAEEKEIGFTFHASSSGTIISADHEALVKIISNMLSNAVKFSDTYVHVSLKSNEESVELRVDNDGTRIPESEATHIFQPFYRSAETSSRTSAHGSGLGLPLAKSLAEMHNGKFYYDSEDKSCNSFVLVLPVEQITSEETENQENYSGTDKQEAPAYDKKNETSGINTILIVEDEKDMRSFISSELSDEYNIIEACNGQQAIEILDNHNVSLVITDLMMPILDGISLCRNLKESIKYCHIPIIVLTAKVSMEAHLQVLESKADAYIEKPFSTDHLKAQISNLIANREILRSTVINSPYAYLSSMASNSMDRKMIEKMNDYVMGHLSDSDLSVEALADHMNMSISTLYRKIKSATSLSPNDFIKLCKLKKAAEMLSQGDMRVSEVSDQLGFSKSSYFSACFMKQFGMTPHEFIKKSRNQ